MRVFLLLVFAFFLSCSETDFDPDIYDYRLPAYTERGNNAAGGYWNDEVWLMQGSGCFFPSPCDWEFSMRVNSAEETIQIRLGSFDLRDIQFVLLQSDINNIADMRLLEGQEFMLSTNSNLAFVSNLNSPTDCLATSGRIIIHRVTDELIAGTFAFEIPSDGNCEAISFRSGRFDLQLIEDETIFFN